MSLNFNNVIIGGTSGGGGQTINNQDITVTENGEYTAESGYTGLGTVTVDVPTGGGGGLEYAPFTINTGTTSAGQNVSLHPTVEAHFYKRNIYNMGGTPVTMDESVLSGFSADTMVGTTGAPFNMSEFQIVFTTAGDVTTFQGIMGETFPYGTSLCIDNGNLCFAVGNGETIAVTNIDFSVSANTKYWFKFTQDLENSTLTPYISTDGETYTQGSNLTSISEFGSMLGLCVDTSMQPAPFLGSIDLLGSYYVGQYDTWNGITEGTKTNYDYVVWGETFESDVCKITTTLGSTVETTAITYDVSNETDGDYFVFKNSENSDLWLSSNLTVSNYAPLNPVNGDCWYNTLSPITELKIYDGTNSVWVDDTNSVYVGKCEVYSGHVLSCTNRAFNTVLKPTINAVGNYYVKVIDYDGSLIDIQYLNAGDTYTLPAQPEHDGLIFQEWSSTKPIVNNTITITNKNVLVGAIYDTASGKSEIDIWVKASQSITLSGISGSIDWGDGTVNTTTSHTYSTAGNYTIKFSGGIGTVSNNIINTGNTPNIDYVKAIRLSSDVTTIPYNAFYKLRNMNYITIPKGVTTIGASQGQGVFSGAKGLTHLILPSTVTSILGGIMSDCYALKTFIASSITSIPSSCFYQSYALNEIVIPESVTSIGQYAFYHCFAMAGTVIMPSGLSSVGEYAFNENLATDAYDFSYCTSIPTLANTNAFSLQQSDKIYVPADLIDQWKTTSNWSSISSYITTKP